MGKNRHAAAGCATSMHHGLALPSRRILKRTTTAVMSSAQPFSTSFQRSDARSTTYGDSACACQP